MSQDTIKPDDNSINFEPTTIEDAASTESPAAYAAKMKGLAERFDLLQEVSKPESSWQNITNIDGYLVGTTADGTKVVFASDHGDLIIKHPDGRSENRTATVEEVEKMFSITMSKMKNSTDLAEEVKENKEESSGADHENHKKCSSCGNWNQSAYLYCGKCRAPFPLESVVERIDIETQRRNEEHQRIEEGINKRHLENTKQVEGVASFDELYKVLGSFARYDLRRLYEDFDFHRDYRQMIEASRDSFVTRDKLPVDYGIRKKVFELYSEYDNKKFAKKYNQNPIVNESVGGISDSSQEESAPVPGWKNISNADGILIGVTSNDIRVIFTRFDNSLLLGYPDGKKETKIVSVEEVEKMFGITMSGKDSSGNSLLQNEQIKSGATIHPQDFSDKQEQLDSNMEHTKKVEGVDIESLSDLKEGMEIMIPVGSNVVKGRIDRLDIANGVCLITYPVINIDQNGKETISRTIAEIEPNDSTFLSTLKLLNNDSKSPWFRHEVGKEVLINRSNGSITLAKIAFYNKDGSARVEWVENGRGMGKTVSIAEIDSMNKENEGSGLLETENNHQEELDSTTENTKKVEVTNSFEELFNVMDSFGEFIPRSNGQKVWTVNVKNTINKYRDGSILIDAKDVVDNLTGPSADVSNALKSITGTFGLRKKVYQLMKKEGSGMILKKDGSFKKGLI